ncbi:PspC domain-containing protein [bacterium]|nr:PspC domain-containing protein [FCB group bacterium]MBL7191031.1 PspC domain-containing protein [bacterium]
MIIRPGRAVTDSAQPEISSSGATTGTGSQDRSGRRLYRSRSRVILGVAGGTAEYFKIDPGLCRLLWILFILITGGIGLLVYIALAFALPESGSDNFSKEK